jgi:predicted CopG family antitoxin
MNTITVDVPDPVYRDLQDYAKRVDRPVSELIREAMELYRDLKIGRKRMSLLDMPSFSVGKILKPLGPDDDLLGEMLEGRFE